MSHVSNTMADADLSPIERLLERGAPSLSDAELLTVALRLRKCEKARQVLDTFGGISPLLASDAGALRRHGITETGAATLGAACELVRRGLEADFRRQPLDRTAEVVRYLFARHHTPDQEVLGALFLDARLQLITERIIFRGTISRAAVEPRQILRIALQHNAVSIAVWHTHTSSEVMPSRSDVLFTRQLDRACRLVGLRLLDHLIIGHAQRWRSMRDHGDWLPGVDDIDGPPEAISRCA